MCRFCCRPMATRPTGAVEHSVNIDRLDTGAALDWEARLFEDVSRHPEKRFLRCWEGTQSLVVPKKLAALPAFPAVADRMTRAGWPVHVRATGGDATPQGPGILNVTHVYTWASDGVFDIEGAYDRLCAPIENALGPEASRGWQPGAFCDGAYNVQWQGRKFAGTAMRFRAGREDKSNHTVLAHALMLMAPPGPEVIDAINELLSGLDQDRRIQAEAHTGLPRGTSAEIFLDRLENGFREVDPGL